MTNIQGLMRSRHRYPASLIIAKHPVYYKLRWGEGMPEHPGLSGVPNQWVHIGDTFKDYWWRRQETLNG